MKKGTVLNEVFDRLKGALEAVEAIEGLEFAKSPDYGARLMHPHPPTLNLKSQGDALSIWSAAVCLPLRLALHPHRSSSGVSSAADPSGAPPNRRLRDLLPDQPRDWHAGLRPHPAADADRGRDGRQSQGDRSAQHTHRSTQHTAHARRAQTHTPPHSTHTHTHTHGLAQWLALQALPPPCLSCRCATCSRAAGAVGAWSGRRAHSDRGGRDGGE